MDEAVNPVCRGSARSSLAHHTSVVIMVCYLVAVGRTGALDNL
jgi:hypothetical protein